MSEPALSTQVMDVGRLGRRGPVTLAQVMEQVEEQVVRGDLARFEPMPTGFHPLDDVLNGGLRAGELLILGGRFGVGKTIFGLQVARNVARSDERNRAMYVCYEHDAAHLLWRLLCLESAERGDAQDALTLRKLDDLAFDRLSGPGFISKLRRRPRQAMMLDEIDAYSSRLLLVEASSGGDTLDRIRDWVEDAVAGEARHLLLVVDYLQKIPTSQAGLQSETEVTIHVAHGLKELAVSLGIRVIAIAASDRQGLRARRMRLADLRGASALQYEADIGLMLHNKHDIVSREYLVYNPGQAEALRNWVVMTVEKNRAGINAVDMEYALDAAHFRLVPTGGFVRERLVDQRVILD